MVQMAKWAKNNRMIYFKKKSRVLAKFYEVSI